MAHVVLELPSMYGDHHVLEVRNILLGIDGVKEVYASSSFQAAEVEFDGRKTSQEDIKKILGEAGYSEEFSLPEELSIPATEQKDEAYFRHTEAYQQTKNTVGFQQTVRVQSSPLWPCPGMGVLKAAPLDVEKENQDG